MQNPISDFSKEMQEYVAGLLEQRYGQVQADHERLSANLSAAATIAALEGDEYHGPLVI